MVVSPATCCCGGGEKKCLHQCSPHSTTRCKMEERQSVKSQRWRRCMETHAPHVEFSMFSLDELKYMLLYACCILRTWKEVRKSYECVLFYVFDVMVELHASHACFNNVQKPFLLATMLFQGEKMLKNNQNFRFSQMRNVVIYCSGITIMWREVLSCILY